MWAATQTVILGVRVIAPAAPMSLSRPRYVKET
jgi:hypothetical protein